MEFVNKGASLATIVFVFSSMLAVGLSLTMGQILSLYGSRGVIASILFLVAGSIMGWFLGGPAVETRSVMALGTAQRNIAAALVVC